MEVTELKELIKRNLSGCNGYAFIDRTLEDLERLISKHKTFNCEKFANWFVEKNVCFKNSPLGFLTKCGFEDIERGAFDDFDMETASLDMQPLINAMRTNKIDVDKSDAVYIYVIEEHLLKRGLMPLEDLREWNHKAVDYLANKDKTTKDFIYLFKNTKVMRALKIPFNELYEEASKLDKEWNSLLEEIENYDPTAIGGYYIFGESETK